MLEQVVDRGLGLWMFSFCAGVFVSVLMFVDEAWSNFADAIHQAFALAVATQHAVQIEPRNAEALRNSRLRGFRFRLALTCCPCNAHEKTNITIVIMPQPKKITNEIFAANLRARMDALGATQEMISTDLGIAQSAVSNYLNGRVPRFDILSELANYLGSIPVEELVGRNVSPLIKPEIKGNQETARLTEEIENDPAARAFYQKLRKIPRKDRTRLLRAMGNLLDEFQK